MNLLDQIPTKLRRAASTKGGEYQGACPWCGGSDRFHVWPEKGERGEFWCRGCERQGDAIAFMMEFHGHKFADACKMLGLDYKLRADSVAPSTTRARDVKQTVPPPEKWQESARAIASECADLLWTDTGARALAWLRNRGLTDESIRTGSFGYNPVDRWQKPEEWGMERDKDIWIPRGITIPWVIRGEIWRLNIRRPEGDPKYIGPAGSSNGLYLADFITPDRPAVIVEGEIDAWSVNQQAYDLAITVATGSTDGARRTRWVSLLSLASIVLVAFDSDEPGEKAAAYWTGALPHARRWRPYWADANTMLQDGVDLRSWIAAGLQGCKQTVSHGHMVSAA